MAYKRNEHNLAVRRKWYQEHKERITNTVKHRQAGIRDWFQAYKSTLKCMRCSESDPACLDFHHIDPKTKEYMISGMVCASKKRILEEIAKCEVLCANCHRKLHHGAEKSTL